MYTIEQVGILMWLSCKSSIEMHHPNPQTKKLWTSATQALTIYGTLLTWISWLTCTVEHVETIWCGWWAFNPVFHALQPLHKQGVDLCKMDTTMYESFDPVLHPNSSLTQSMFFFFVKSSSHNPCYFVGLNLLIAMCCRAGGNYLMCLSSSESNIACSPALTQTSCGPCKNRLIWDSSSNPNQPCHFVGLNFLLSHVEN